MYLFFDTETTGLPLNYKAPVSDSSNWPRMVQIAWLYYNADGKLIEQADYIIKPDGYRIPTEVSRIHGITTERAMAEGRPLAEVLSDFAEMVSEAEVLVAHNMSFDEMIIGAEFYRESIECGFFEKSRICTMKVGTNYCKIPGKYGFKWPKLAELHQVLFNRDFDEAHNAAYDILATARCFWELKKLGVIAN